MHDTYGGMILTAQKWPSLCVMCVRVGSVECQFYVFNILLQLFEVRAQTSKVLWS